MKRGELIDQLSDYQLVKNDSAQWHHSFHSAQAAAACIPRQKLGFKLRN
jgi:hypothetical protein